MRQQHQGTSSRPHPILRKPKGLGSLGCALALILGLGAEPLVAETRTVQARFADFQARVDEKAGALAREPRFKQFSAHERDAGLEFLVGNMVFVAAHEMGHAVISELDLPVLGREEDAADTFAIITALKVIGTDFSYRVLEEAVKGWFWSARRGKRDGDTPALYGEHGLDEQRAYQIVCLMVGSDPDRFKQLADEVKLPAERRRSCAWNFDTTWRSWEKLLAPHRRAADQPKMPIEVIYGEAKGKLEVSARWFRSMRFLEIVAEVFADSYSWPAPITIEMRSCGEPGARWTVPHRKLHICYEIADEFAQLYGDYGRERKTSKRQPKQWPIARTSS
jgi:hypothetical protein